MSRAAGLKKHDFDLVELDLISATKISSNYPEHEDRYSEGDWAAENCG
jgi:hypothetical protein